MTTDLIPEDDLQDLSIRQRAAAHWFRSMGFESEQALCLSLAEAPPAKIERAIWNGCSLEQAFEIWT